MGTSTAPLILGLFTVGNATVVRELSPKLLLTPVTGSLNAGRIFHSTGYFAQVYRCAARQSFCKSIESPW
jgi:hypothetical protein